MIRADPLLSAFLSGLLVLAVSAGLWLIAVGLSGLRNWWRRGRR